MKNPQLQQLIEKAIKQLENNRYAGLNCHLELQLNRKIISQMASQAYKLGKTK